MTKVKSVLIMGFSPAVGDYKKYPHLNAELLQQLLDESYEVLKKKGVDVVVRYFQDDGKDEGRASSALAEKQFDIVMIGAGVRTDPDKFGLFEKVVNLVHKAAPQASICFNTTKVTDTADAVLRHVSD
jgi:hypothetical protein